jgi:hypothetical protein
MQQDQEQSMLSTVPSRSLPSRFDIHALQEAGSSALPTEQDWCGHEYARNAILGKTLQEIRERLTARLPGPRDHEQDDRLFGPLNMAIYRAAMSSDFGLAFYLFHESTELVREYERRTGSILHKGAPTFNVGLAYLAACDFTAAMHYFEVAQAETRASYGEANFKIYEFGLFDRIFWGTFDASVVGEPNTVYQALWGRPFDAAAAKADWQKLSDASRLHYIIGTAQRMRYRQLAELGAWDGSESLRLAYWVLAADLGRLVETEARRRSTVTSDNLMGLLCGGFKRVGLGDLSARIQNWHANTYKVKSTATFNQHFPAIRATIEDDARSAQDRVGHAAYLAGVTRNQVAHTVDPSLVLYQDPEAARFVTDLLFAVCHLDGWAA